MKIKSVSFNCSAKLFFKLRDSLSFGIFNIVPVDFWSVITMKDCPNSMLISMTARHSPSSCKHCCSIGMGQEVLTFHTD